MGKYTAITSECLVPMDKANYVPMSRVPPLSAQIVIGTPGTIRKYILNGKLGLSYIKILVFDEADLMLDDVSFFCFVGLLLINEHSEILGINPKFLCSTMPLALAGFKKKNPSF